jgi:predicted ATPase/class 3 adenylate cyclase
MTEAEHLEAAIAALQAQRLTLGDAVVQAALGPLRERIARLRDGETPSTAVMQRRQVTVLFADVVGSTTMSAQLDAEDVVRLMSRALERFAAAVHAHHGRVLRYTGDGLKAVFGADEALEDAPESAVRAGLGILEAARSYAVELREQTGFDACIDDFQARVGLDTGLVALGAGIEAENTAMGPTVNLASRMEQTAPAGGLRISQATYRHVRGVFDVTEAPPLSVKGIAEPVRSYLVHRAKPRAFRIATRGIEGLETPMIGRDAELGRLQADFEAVNHERRLRAVSLLGEAGIGKSRMLYELQNWLETHEQSFWLLLGRAHPHSRLQPYGLLRDLVAWRLQIDDSDSGELARRKLVEGLRTVLGADAQPELLGQLIGLDFSASPAVQAVAADARRLRDKALGVGIEWLRCLSAADDTPIVLLLDDLHWADDGSLEFVRRVLGAHELPLFVVMLARPELIERHPDWGDAAGAAHRLVRVKALDRTLSGRLAETLLQRLDAVPQALRDLVIDGAEGNPFYMEELVKMLIDDGVIVVDADNTRAAIGAAGATSIWRVQPDRLRDARVPGTLAGVLQARLHALNEHARSALQDASVIGHVFWDRALAAIDAQAPASLEELLQREMTLARPDSTFSGSREYAFVHHLLQQVTYDSVLKARRQAAHARAAAWLAQHLHERADEFVAVTAEHYARAGNRAEAVRYFEQAARNAAERYANGEALEQLGRGLELVREDDVDTRWRLLDRQLALLDQLGRYDEMATTLDAQFALAQQGDDPRRLSRVAVQRAVLADRRSEYDKACTLAFEAAALAEQAGDFESATLAHCQFVYASTVLGEYPRARASVEIGLQHSQRCDSPLFEAKILGVWAYLESFAGNDRAARDALLRALAIAQQCGELRLEGVTSGNLADIQARLGEYEAAGTSLEASLRIARKIELRSTEGRALLGLAQIDVVLGNFEAATEHARAAIEIAAAIGDRHARSLALTSLAQALTEIGDHTAAVAAAREAIEEEAACGNQNGESVQIALAVLARATLHLADIAAALQQVERLLGLIAQAHDAAARNPGVFFTCYQVLTASRDQRAAQMLADAHDALLALADSVDPATRERYLDGVPEHRRIVAAWASQAERDGTLSSKETQR